MATMDISYDVDGATTVDRLALPTGHGSRPGILIVHEGNGLDDHQKTGAQRFADLGYVAFALDYHGDGTALSDRDEINARLGLLYDDPDRALARAVAGLHVLRAQPRTDAAQLAAVGYCFGGKLVLDLARSGADLRAVVGFNPDLTTPRPQDAVNIVGKILVCVGADDPLVSVDPRLAFETEMRHAGVDWQMTCTGETKHSFTHERAGLAGMAALEYNERSDRRSWRALLDLLDETFPPDLQPIDSRSEDEAATAGQE